MGQVVNIKWVCIIYINNGFLLDRLKRVAALAKQSLMYYGSFGITAFLCGTVFVDRSPRSLNKCHE